MIAVVLPLVRGNARNVVHRLGDARHELIVNERARHHCYRLRHVAKPGCRFRARVDRGNIASGLPGHFDGLGETGNLQDELERRRAARGNGHASREVGKSGRANPDEIRSGLELEGEVAVLIRDRRRRYGRRRADRRHLSAGNRGAHRVDDPPAERAWGLGRGGNTGEK